MPAHPVRTAKKRKALLGAIARGLTVSEAAREAGMSRQSVFLWRKDDPEFNRDYEIAYEEGTDVFEVEARKRAFEGLSDVLLIFLLKQRDAQRFNKRMIEMRVEGDLTMAHGLLANGDESSDEVVRFYLPDNGRCPPELVERIQPPLPVIEATAESVGPSPGPDRPREPADPQRDGAVQQQHAGHVHADEEHADGEDGIVWVRASSRA